MKIFLTRILKKLNTENELIGFLKPTINREHQQEKSNKSRNVHSFTTKA